MNENWTLVSTIWRLEFLAVTVTAWISLYFSFRFNSWSILVVIDHLFMMVEYMLMLGGYPHIISNEMFEIVNNIAIWIFISSNFIWLVGISGVNLKEKGWVRYLGGGFALLCGLIFLSVLFSLIGIDELIFAGPLVVILNLINGYYGFKILTVKD